MERTFSSALCSQGRLRRAPSGVLKFLCNVIYAGNAYCLVAFYSTMLTYVVDFKNCPAAIGCETVRSSSVPI